MSDSEIIFIVEESPEGGYEAKALGQSIYTQAESLEELRKMVQDAVRCHFEERDRPRMIRLHLVRDEVIPV
ncbi:MAG: 2-oxoisovalerate dehydrogenase [Chloroflexi bacterium]|nr:2-oxoisovalerate dehydrogenase [Chloroflexota bacterium]